MAAVTSSASRNVEVTTSTGRPPPPRSVSAAKAAAIIGRIAGGDVRSRAETARERASPMVSEMVGSEVKRSTSPVRVTETTYNPTTTTPFRACPAHVARFRRPCSGCR